MSDSLKALEAHESFIRAAEDAGALPPRSKARLFSDNKVIAMARLAERATASAERLIKLVESLKCCGNCKHEYINEARESDCDLDKRQDNSKWTDYSLRLFDGQWCEQWQAHE